MSSVPQAFGTLDRKSTLFKLIAKFFLKRVVFMFWYDIVFIELLYCVTNFELVWTWIKVAVVENAKKCRLHPTYYCSWLHRLEPLRQAQEKDGNSGHWVTGEQPASKRDPSLTSLYYYEVALSLYRDKWTTIIRLWWLSQWLVTHGHH